MCTVNIVVEDRLPALVLCPSDIVILCDKDQFDLSATGQLQVEYNCKQDVKTDYQDQILSDDCESTIIERTWIYVDTDNHKVNACLQTIIIEKNTIADVKIAWPVSIDI